MHEGRADLIIQISRPRRLDTVVRAAAAAPSTSIGRGGRSYASVINGPQRLKNTKAAPTHSSDSTCRCPS